MRLRGRISPSAKNRIVESALVVALVALTITLHLWVPGLVPSGPDGGNWLAMAQNRFLARDVMAAAVTYPPLLPFVLAGLLLPLQPIVAITTIALAAKCLFAFAVYLCARPMGRAYALAAAVLVATAGAQLEAYSWGAYPQILGTAFGIACTFYAVRFVVSRHRAELWAALALALLTYATHTLVGGLLLFAVPIAVAHGLWLARGGREDWIRGAWTALLLSGPGALLAAYNFMLNPQPGVQPVLNPLSQGWSESVAKTISDAPVPWVLVSVMGIGALVIRRWEPPRAFTVATSSAWVAVGTLFFAVIGEPRALLLTQFGLVLLALLLYQRMIQRIREWPWERGLVRSAIARSVAILGIATLSAIVVGGIDSYSNATSWYRVVDHQEIEALDVLQAEASPGDLVVAARGHHGNQTGWWVQGYAGLPTFTGVDPRFLTFPEERDQAIVANEFFAQKAINAKSLETLSEIGADFLVVDRRGPDSGWLDSEMAQRFHVIYDSPTVVVLRV